MSSESQNQNGSNLRNINKLSSIVGNMALAHEVALNDKFELTSVPDNTLEKRVQKIVHQAFWDHIKEQLEGTPPKYEHALTLVMDIKENLMSLLLAHHASLKEQIEEVLDQEFIRQEVEHGCFDLKQITKFVILVMTKLCAPVRDEDVKRLQEIEDMVPLLRGIMEVLDLMKLDMANFQLQSLRPYLIQQSVDYEREKFKEYLKENPDGLQLTKRWLQKAFKDVSLLIQAARERQNEENPTDSLNNASHNVNGVNRKPSPSMVLTHAYLSLLDWKDEWIYPETLLMDELRLAEMNHMFHRLALIGSILVITLNMVGEHLSTDAAYLKKLKDKLFIILEDVPERDLSKAMPGVCDQILQETTLTLEERGLKPLASEQKEALKGQISGVVSQENSVHKLLKSRIRDYVLLCMTLETKSQKTQIPIALSTIQDELQDISGRFARLIMHNKNVHQPFYMEIIESLSDYDINEKSIDNERTKDNVNGQGKMTENNLSPEKE